MSTNAQQLIADSLHEGVVCPACQREISIGDRIWHCTACSSFSHDRCWNSSGCQSYHCSGHQTPSAAQGSLGAPALVITKQETQGVVLPPRGRMYTTETLAKEAAKKDKHWSPLSFVALFLGCTNLVAASFLCVSTFSGVSTSPLGIIATLLAGVLTVIVAALAMASIQTHSSAKGHVPAIVGLLAGALGAGLGLYSVAGLSSDSDMDPVTFDPGKIKEFVMKSDARIRQALMANVHVSAGRSVFAKSQGSGIVLKVIGKTAYVLSNLHVITGGKRSNGLDNLKARGNLVVTFFSGENRPADPVWVAPHQIDLVLLKVEAPDKFDAIAPIDRRAEVSIGQKVFAVGNPMGLNWSYTEGVVSGLRSQQFGPHELNVIQMQTPLNPGNSGGGLYDQEGHLIGVNTWIYAKSQSEGLNFSIAIDGFLQVLDAQHLQTLQLNTSETTSGENNVNTPEAPPSGLR